MNRRLTNIIRFIIDECIPSIIRDNKYFMYPFFLYAYRGKNIKDAMNFKTLVYNFTNQEYIDYYSKLNSISRNRKTDINKPTLKYALQMIEESSTTLIDIGCGNGYFLNKVNKIKSSFKLHGCDIIEKKSNFDFAYTKADINKLPFKDKEFDVVTCFHTLEHIINPSKAIEELKRIAKKQIIICVPCQRYFYYTLDEHVNFYFFKAKLINEMNIQKYICKKIAGDYIFIGHLE